MGALISTVVWVAITLLGVFALTVATKDVRPDRAMGRKH